MLRHYFKIALRHLLKYKMQNIISIVGLSVGLLCFSICLYVNRFMGSVDQCFEHHKRLVELTLAETDGRAYSGTPFGMIKELYTRQWAEVEAFTAVSYVRKRPYNVQIDESRVLPYELHTMEVDSLYELFFTPSVIAGSWQNAVHTPNAAILMKSAARRMFPHYANAIGHQMVLSNRLGTSPSTTPQSGGIVYTIVAVIEDLPANTSLNFMGPIDLLTLNDSEGAFQITDKNFTGTTAYALLHKGKTIEDFENAIKKSGFRYSLFTDNDQIKVMPIGQRESIQSVTFIFGLVTGIAGILILLIGLLNFYHFQTGSFLNRYREFTLRKVLGNKISGLFYMQFLQMSLVLFLALLLTGCLIEAFSSSLYLSLFQFNIQIEKEVILWHLFQYAFGLLFLSSLVCISTAFHCRHLNIQTGLRGSGKRGGKRRLRNILLGIQFFICWLFVCMTVALYLQAVKTTESLYDTLSHQEKQEIIGFSLSYTFLKDEEKLAFIDQISQHSGIKEIMLTDVAFTQGLSGNGLYEGKEESSYVDVGVIQIPSNFISFMHLPLIAGRTPQTSDNILVSRSLAEKQKKDILGKVYYNWDKKEYTVCGVVDNFNTYIYNDGFGQQYSQCVYLPSETDKYIGYCYLKCLPGQVDAVRSAIYKKLKNTLPESVEPQIMSLIEEIQEQQEMENKLKDIVLFFTIVSLIITLLGVYAAITLDTEHRQKEIAIRKINGAGMIQIILLFARLYAILLVSSAAVAFPIVFLIISQWKSIYKVFFNDGCLYWGGIFLSITLLIGSTVLFRILKIARINPTEIIKNE